jgi:hypothetical protein
MDALNLIWGGNITHPPVAKVDISADIRPCTWKSGMISKTVSFGVKLYVLDILFILAIKLAWVSGTPWLYGVE